MKAIAAIDKKGGLGKDGKLLFHISDDLKRFKELTQGQIVVMGRKTLESLPDGKPLPNRTNVVISRDPDYIYKAPEGCQVLNSVGEVVADIFIDKKDKEVFIIGGGEMYRQFLPFIDTIYLTVVDKEFEADTFFPELDDRYWECKPEDISDKMFDNDNLGYQFMTYHKKTNEGST